MKSSLQYLTLKILCNNIASQVAPTFSLYSASIVESAIEGCFLLAYEITPLPREKT
jgi:hypothetical protein